MTALVKSSAQHVIEISDWHLICQTGLAIACSRLTLEPFHQKRVLLSNELPNKSRPTQKEIAFCKAYLANNFKGLDALREAGYSAGNLHVLLRDILERPRVQGYLEELQETAAAAAVLSKAWVIGEAVQLYREAREAKAFAPASKLLSMLGSEVGALQENKQINQTVTVEHMLGNIPKGLQQSPKQIN